MKTKHLLLSLLALALVCSCGSRPRPVAPEGFSANIMLKTTPAKIHGESPVDWCCAMLDVIETEHLMQGDSVNLSFDYVMRCWLRQQAVQYMRTKGEGDITARGIGPMIPELLRSYGCFPYDSYNSLRPVNYNVLARRIKMLADVAVARGDSEETFLKTLDGLLDREIGFLPKRVYMLRAEYTPLEFAHSVCGKNEYAAFVASDGIYSDRRAVIPHPDNTTMCMGRYIYYDSVYVRIQRALDARHPVLWTSTESEDGTAAIIGTGHDKHGNKYFVAKGSPKSEDKSAHLLYIPDSYIRNNTAFVMTKEDL